MKQLVWEAPKVMAVRDQKRPDPAHGEVLVRVAYAGICGSELAGYLGHNSLRTPPLVMGHEFSGTVESFGPRGGQKRDNIKVGQAITVNPFVHCGMCKFCNDGLTQLCVARKLIGAHRPGAFSEYVSVPEEQVLPLPDSMDMRVGALTEPVAVGVRIGEQAGDLQGSSVFIAGAGPIGLLVLQALRLRGAGTIFITELDHARCAMAAKLGGEAIDPQSVDVVSHVLNETDGEGVSIAVDAVGTAGTMAHCVAVTATMGKVILCGLHEESSIIPVGDVVRREIILKGSMSYSQQNFREAIQCLESGSMRLEPWIVEAPLEDGGQWFDRLLDEPGAVAKVLLKPGEV